MGGYTRKANDPDTAKAIEEGWTLIELGYKTKRPKKEWTDENNQFSDKKEKADLLSQKYTNYGIICGKRSNLSVLDFDLKNEGINTLKELQEDYPKDFKTYSVKSGSGGYHYYFEFEDEIKSGTTAVGLDIIGQGKYIVGPGSTHSDGPKYRVVKSGKVLKMSDELRSTLTTLRNKKKETDNREKTFQHGERNERLYKLACSKMRLFRDKNELLLYLLWYNKQYCRPPKTDNKIETIWNSACKHWDTKETTPEVLQCFSLRTLKGRKELVGAYNKQNLGKIPTGYDNLDEVLKGGWKKGGTYCFLGLTGVGKSIFLINTARMAWDNSNVLFLTTEMPGEEQGNRLLKARYKQDDINDTLEDTQSNENEFDFIDLLPGHYDVSSIRKIIKHKEWPVEILVIDYLEQLITDVAASASEYERQGKISKDLSGLAKELKIPIITATQANRRATDEKGSSPNWVGTWNIGDSKKIVDGLNWLGGIVQERHNRDTNTFKLCIDKNRFGPSGSEIYFEINYEMMLLTEMSKTQYNTEVKVFEKKQKKDAPADESETEEDRIKKTQKRNFNG